MIPVTGLLSVGKAFRVFAASPVPANVSAPEPVTGWVIVCRCCHRRAETQRATPFVTGGPALFRLGVEK